MTIFFICAVLLVLLCVGWLLLGLFRSSEVSTDQEAVNITLARERRETLDVALRDGAIDQDTHDYERRQLEYDLAADLSAASETTTRKGGHIAAAIVISIFIPITAGALYLQLGNPAAITQPREAPPAITDAQDAPDMDTLLPQMEARLAEQPDDIQGWRLLGRSYLSIGNFTGARNALEKALALDKSDVPTMTQLAEAIAMTQQGDLSGEPTQIIMQANTLDPDNEHALWLLSIARQQSGDHATAMQGFDRLLELASGNTEALASINEMRARSVDAMAGSNSSPAAQSSDDQANSETVPADESANVSIEVSVNLSEQARAATTADQVVYVYATASQGPPMPLAVSRLSVADLPATVTLDNSMAMIPNMTLSAFPSVTVGARISTTGDPIAQSGDWFTEAPNVTPAGTGEVELTIDQLKP